MKKSLLFGAALVFLGTSLSAQRKCGIVNLQNQIIAEHPEFATQLAARTTNLQAESDQYYEQIKNNQAGKTTTTYSPIPVVFHIIVSSAQLTQIGGNAGAAARAMSQITVLNNDYNRHNSDSTLIPSGWKSLFKSSGIKFGLAHTDPSGHSTPGYEIKVTSTSFTQGSTGDYYNAKHTANGGLDAWDVTKYLNIWCIFFSDNTGLLGITTPFSFTTPGGGPLPFNDMGFCVSYDAFGKRVSSSDHYAGGGVYDAGRTSTHEMGHFFELRHTWGDDGGSCPWSGGSDDGIADTPPESDMTFGNPTYTISGGTLYDGCKMNGSTNMQPIGFPCLDFMDYTDDVAMHMFTTGQVGVMDAQVLSTTGENFTLTQHPSLLNFPTEVSSVEKENKLNIFPNPTDGTVNISFDDQADQLNQIIIVNTLGQTIQKMDGGSVKNGYLSVDLSGFSKGIYFVTCNFASGSITRKILLQ